MYLFINTSKENNLDVFLIKEEKIIGQISLSGDFKVSENLLKIINQLLAKYKIEFEDLKGVLTVVGPGPFTSLRIAVSVTNTLAYTLKIPVCGIINDSNYDDKKLIDIGLKNISKSKIGQLLKPHYAKEPNIT